MLSRRSLLASLAIPAVTQAGAWLGLDPVTQDLVALPDPDGKGPPVLLPAARAWIAFAGHLAGAHLVAVQFTVESHVFVAFCGGRGFCLQDVQLWHGRDATAEYGSILRLAVDGSQLMLVHDWARHERQGVWRREHWTDRFGWGADGRLANLPGQKPDDTSAQARFAASRKAISRLLPDQARFVPQAAITLQTESFSLGSKAQPSMRHTPSEPRSIV